MLSQTLIPWDFHESYTKLGLSGKLSKGWFKQNSRAPYGGPHDPHGPQGIRAPGPPAHARAWEEEKQPQEVVTIIPTQASWCYRWCNGPATWHRLSPGVHTTQVPAGLVFMYYSCHWLNPTLPHRSHLEKGTCLCNTDLVQNSYQGRVRLFLFQMPSDHMTPESSAHWSVAAFA